MCVRIGEVNILEQCVRVAIKRAELKKLTKEERKQIKDVDFIFLRLFGFIFIVMGGLFAIALTLGMILLGIVACLVVAQPDKIYEVIGEIPWWKCILATWAMYGGIMGVLTIIAKRK